MADSSESGVYITSLQHRMRSWILRILKVPKIQDFFNEFQNYFKIHKIQITFIAAKIQQTHPFNFTLKFTDVTTEGLCERT